MIFASLPLGLQRRYDLFLAFVPIALVGAPVASWAFPVPLHVSTVVAAAIVGLVVLTVILRHPPRES